MQTLGRCKIVDQSIYFDFTKSKDFINMKNHVYEVFRNELCIIQNGFSYPVKSFITPRFRVKIADFSSDQQAGQL